MQRQFLPWLGTLAIGVGVVRYLRRPLRNLLIELCGNQERAEFWTEFSAVAVAVVPVIFASAVLAVPRRGRELRAV